MELVDVADSKSADGNIMWVRVPPPAPKNATRKGGVFYEKNIRYAQIN